MKDGVYAQKRSRFCATKSVVSKAPLSTSISTTKSTLNTFESTHHFTPKLNIKEATSEESKKGEENKINKGEKKNVASNVSVSAPRQKDILDMIKYVDTFIKQLDKSITTANSKQEVTKELAITKATRLYQKYLSPPQQKTKSLDYLIAQGTHNVSDNERVIALKLTHNTQSGWYCNICKKGIWSTKKRYNCRIYAV